MFEYEKRMVQNDIIALLVNCQVWKVDVCPSSVRFFRAMPDYPPEETSIQTTPTTDTMEVEEKFTLLTYEDYLALSKTGKVAYDFNLYANNMKHQWKVS